MEIQPRTNTCPDPDVTLFTDPARAAAARGLRRLGRFTLLELLGFGGMGEVWRAWDPVRCRQVALKRVLADMVGRGHEARLVREGRLLSQVRHPNVLSVLEVTEADGEPMLVLELLEGTSLRGRLERPPIRIEEGLAWARGILLALAATHRAGLIHRDVKPANVFATREGTVKLLDFGLARTEEPEAFLPAAETGAGSECGRAVGTVGYMPPEQEFGEDVDARADVFAFGAVLYHLLTGEPAFALHTLRGPWVRPSGLEFIPGPLRSVTQRCLDLDRSGRPANAEEVLAELPCVGRPERYAA